MKKKFILFKWSFFMAKVIRKLRIPIKINRKFNGLRHTSIEKYLLKQQNQIVAKYKYMNTEFKNENSQIIWLFWWQGEEQMPELVKRCVDSIKYRNSNRQIIVLNQSNFHKYTEIPSFILKKVENKEITITQFSDILRWNLLSHHGGMWMDATLFEVASLSDEWFDGSFFTAGPYDHDKELFNVAEGRWTSFFWGGSVSPFTQFMNEMFLCYWERENQLIDYFLVDYFIDIGVKNNIGGIAEYLNSKDPNNQELFTLGKYLNKEHFPEIQNTKVFKLSYKTKITTNTNSLYYKIISHEFK